ncbi:MAG: IS5 family transposase [Thermaerobacter sp.]|nr:IS5 family transposase [Thermaerobacter sp.]
MYRKPSDQMSVYDFVLPFGGRLKADNRWVKLAALIPWTEIEEKYAELFPNPIGNVAKPARVALGALLIKERCGFTDQETVEQISENPYLQYFLGFKEFTIDTPFDSSLMVHFRKRFTAEKLNDINEMICQLGQRKSKDDNDNDSDGSGCGSPGKDKVGGAEEEPKNQGKLFLDATCAPADIRYPTDISLLNEAREKQEGIIDTLHEPLKGKMKKPRTYRKKARKQYLMAAKTRKPKRKQIRKGIGQQLRYVARNMKTIDKLLAHPDSGALSNRQIRELQVIRELYRQQKYMYDHNIHTVDDRIVSISQPHVRPIVRGKASASTEFGAKVSISLVNGFARIEELSWNNFNEGITLQASVERYRERTGHYPEAVIVDQIYRTRENIRYCKERGIRLSGPPLGRPSEAEKNKDKRLALQDGKLRNAIEGKFGEGKRRYGLGRIMACLRETSEAVIALNTIVMNLEHCLRIHFCHFFRRLFSRMAGLSIA